MVGIKYKASSICPKITCLLGTWLYAGILYGQGAAVVMPLSKSVASKDETIVFFIHNRTDDLLTMAYTPKCDVDGVDHEGQICLDTFAMTCGAEIKDNLIKVAKEGSLRCEVRLTSGKGRFALFKPVFTPSASGDNGKPNAIPFTFSYQPGYLFLLKPAADRFTNIQFDTYVVDNARRARFKINLKELAVPQVVSFSAKILDKKTKKLLRFVRLASDKIADPKRGLLELEDNFANGADQSDVCYQAFVENKSAKDFYNLDGCK